MSRALRTWVVALLFSSALAVLAKDKPRVTVTVHVDEEITHLNNTNDSNAIGIAHSFNQYFNVTVRPDISAETANVGSPAAANAPASGATVPAPEPLQNDGKWCIKSPSGQTVHLVPGGDYKGTLNGTFVHLELPQAKGKPVDVSFSVFDRKWRTRLDIQ